MSDVTFLGLGLMGSSLARALYRRGVDLTVWNRSPGKSQPFAAGGVPVAKDLGSALKASPVIVVCLDNYDVVQAMLQADGNMAALAGRTVVQLSTGTPKEATALQNWMIDRNVRYVDGAILCGPEDIDADLGEILFCGDAAAYDGAPSLCKLAANVRYIGPNIAAASALDMAWLNIFYGSFVATAHSVNMCRAEGVDLAEFIAIFPDDPFVQQNVAKIRENRFDHPHATLEVWRNALSRVQTQAIDAGINPQVPDFFASFFKKAMDAGFGQQEAIAIYKVL